MNGLFPLQTGIDFITGSSLEYRKNSCLAVGAENCQRVKYLILS